MNFKEFMKTTWEPDLYRDKHSFVQEYGTSLIELLNPKPGESILDVGCGTGELTAKIAETSNAVIGIDSSRSMIDRARESYHDIKFQLADVADFNLEQTFDALFSNAALHWVLESNKAIERMFDHLKPGGRLVLEMGGKGNIFTIEQALRSVLRTYGYGNNAEKKVWYFPTLGEYTVALEQAGFQVSAAWLYDRPTPLKDKKNGIIDWIIMFGKSFMEGIPAEEQHQIARQVQDRVAPHLFRSGVWTADYKRLRIVAWK